MGMPGRRAECSRRPLQPLSKLQSRRPLRRGAVRSADLQPGASESCRPTTPNYCKTSPPGIFIAREAVEEGVICVARSNRCRTVLAKLSGWRSIWLTILAAMLNRREAMDDELDRFKQL